MQSASAIDKASGFEDRFPAPHSGKADVKRVTEGRLPEFIAVGPPRTATTWLYKVLKGNVGLPAGLKETQFFLWNYELGLDWYQSFFRHCAPHVPVGEIAPTLFNHPQARERIAKHIPACKIICTLRDPVERAYSEYKLWNALAIISEPFDFSSQRAALDAFPSYASNIRDWMATFGRDRVLVLFHEDLKADAQKFLDSVCAFIGIAPIDVGSSRWGTERVHGIVRSARNRRLARRAALLGDWLIRHRFGRLGSLFEHTSPVFDFCFGRGEKFPALDAATEARLRAMVRPEIEDLENLVGRDLSAWK